MKTGTMIMTGAMLAIGLVNPALAQEAATGTVTQIDRINGTIAIQATQSDTVGANSGGAIEQFKAKDSKMLGDVHAGDRIKFSVTESGGVKTITSFEMQ